MTAREAAWAYVADERTIWFRCPECLEIERHAPKATPACPRCRLLFMLPAPLALVATLDETWLVQRLDAGWKQTEAELAIARGEVIRLVHECTAMAQRFADLESLTNTGDEHAA